MGSEMAQILSLPRVLRDADACVVEWSRRLRTHDRAPALLPGQALFCQAIFEHATKPPGPSGAYGALGVIGCGGGKTLSFLLAPTIVRCSRPLLLLPANLIDQTKAERTKWAAHYRVGRVEMMSYGKLSHPHHRHALRQIKPDLIMLDEAHLLGSGARMRRVWSYLAEHPNTRVIAASGSFVAGDIRPMAFVSKLALRDRTPFPVSEGILEQWASVVNVGGEPDAQANAAFAPLVKWARGRGVSVGISKRRARRALFTRLKTCPGVAVTEGPLRVGVSLSLRFVDPPQTDALAELEGAWRLPDGTDLVDAIEVARHRATLRLGFYYRFDPDTVDDEYMRLRRKWHGKLRALVEYGGHESPAIAEEAVRAQRCDVPTHNLYLRWQAIQTLVAPPETETVWVDRGVLEHTVNAWMEATPEAEDNRRVVWARSRAVRDAFLDQGSRVHWAGEPTTPPNVGPVVVSTAFRRGWNGQHFNCALVLEPPTSGRHMEQLLARHHRHGQLRDVSVHLVMSSKDIFRMGDRAQMAQATTGNAQRWLVADRAREGL